MPKSPVPTRVVLAPPARTALEQLARCTAAPHALVRRAQIVLLAAQGLGSAAIARLLGCSDRLVRKWRSRFLRSPSLEGLHDAHRSGRPPRVPVVARCNLVRLACERPEGSHAPFRDIWTQQSLADALEQRTGHRLSRSEVGRILRFEGLRPHRVHYWLNTQDPDFEAKATAVCDLYLDPPEGAVVLSIDEKPIQILERVHPTHVGPDGTVRYEFEYERHGTCALLAAFDVQSGRVFGEIVRHRTGDALVKFLDDVAAQYPGRDVYVVWDNLNIHFDGKGRRWEKFNAAHEGRFRFVHTPLHASWMNQVEIWFSILQRRLLRYSSFSALRPLIRTIKGFIRHWNRHEAHPFRWTWRSEGAQNRWQRAA